MSADDLNNEFSQHSRTFRELLDDGLISLERYERLMEKLKNDTFFAMDVLSTIEALPIAA